MANSCSFKTSEASTKAWFRTNKLIDKYLNILDLAKFRAKNSEFSKLANEKFGVKGRLFFEENGRAIPNKDMFYRIDAAKGVFYPENEYLRQEKPLAQYLDTKRPSFDKELAQKIQNKLQKLYPEIKLTITNDPIWEEGDNIVNQQEYDNQVNFRLKLVDALFQLTVPKETKRTRKYGETTIPERLTLRLNSKERPYIETNIRKNLQSKGVTNQQIDFIFDYMKSNNIQEISSEDLAAAIISTYSYTVKIDTAKEDKRQWGDYFGNDQPFDNERFILNNSTYILSYDEDTFYGYYKDKVKITEEEFKIAQKQAFEKYKANENTIRPTQYYSNLTVPGGTNYTENEIATPAITPNIKGHAQFATGQGIGWFRSDDKVEGGEVIYKEPTTIDEYNAAIEGRQNKNLTIGGTSTKTRRILEIQSDLFQKGRNNKKLVGEKLEEEKTYQDLRAEAFTYFLVEENGQYAIYQRSEGVTELYDVYNSKEKAQENLDQLNRELQEEIAFITTNKDFIKNQFLQLLNKDNNWVTFFIKSIIQDSAKKGYEKVLFPTGNTASKVEGHATLEEFKKQKENRIKELEEFDKNLDEMKLKGVKDKENEIETLKKWENLKNKVINETNQLKQELARIDREGFGALKPIYNFYENTLANVLRKQGYSPVLVTDEYGNTWNEVAVYQPRDLSNILLQKDEANRIIGQANLKALTVLIDAVNKKQDTLPHEYAHHYISWYRDSPIVQEAIKKWGSEEALVQSIGEQVVKQRGEAYNWWTRFVKWIMNKFNNLSDLDKQQLTQILTDAFLTRKDLADVAEESERVVRERVEIKSKTPDPVFEDPDTALGQFVLNLELSRNSFNVSGTQQSRAIEIADKMSRQLNIDYAIITPEQAVELTKDSRNPYTIGKAPAFFFGEKVYFIEGAITTDSVLHEFSHPLIRAIQKSNPALFKKLYSSAITSDPSLLTEAYAEYEDLRKGIDEISDPVLKEAQRIKYVNLVAEEVLVKALTKAHKLVQDNIVLEGGFKKLIDTLLYTFKQLLRKIFGQGIKVSQLGLNTTLNDLAIILQAGGKINIETDDVNQNDLVAYQQDTLKYVEEFKDVIRSGEYTTFVTLARRMFEGAPQHIELMKTNKNYAEMANVLADEFGREDLQEIRSNLSKYANTLEKKMENLKGDVEQAQNEIVAVVNSMIRLEYMMQRMDKHLDDLKDDPNDRDNAHKAHYYGHIIGYWKKYVDEALTILSRRRNASTSEITALLNRIKISIEKSERSINEIQSSGIANVIYDQWRDMNERALELFEEQIKRFKEKGASQKAIDNAYIEFYGMPEAEYKRFEVLRAKKNKGESVSLEDETFYANAYKASFNGLYVTKEKVERAMRGEGKDANYANSYFEGYLYNTDPVIGGFAKFYKDNIIEMEARAQSRINDILSEINPLIEDAGIKFTNIGALGKKLGFVDRVGYTNQKGEFGIKEVWTLLNEWKDYRYDVDKLDHDINQAQSVYNKSNKEEDREKLIVLLDKKKTLLRNYFHQEYVDEYYETQAMFEKDKIGLLAAKARNDIFNRMRVINSATGEYDVEDVTDEMDVLWKEYKLLSSLYYPDGKMKTDSFVDSNGETIYTYDLSIAKRIQEYQAASRKFYQYRPRPEVFQNALINKEQEIFQRLISEGMSPTDEKFKKVYEKERLNWLNDNIRIVIKPEFYQQRKDIINKIQAILSKLPQSKLDFSAQWTKIIDITGGYRDTDGQPEGNKIPAGRLAAVKKAQEEIESAKALYAGFTGLTTEEYELLQNLTNKKKDGKLTKSQQATYLNLINRRDRSGLSEEDKADVANYFSQLADLQRKEPTEYYIDAVNYWLSKVGDDEVYEYMGQAAFTSENIHLLYDPDFLEMMFEKSTEFKTWFEENHLKKTVKKRGVDVDVYDRLYVWNKIVPNDIRFYETTTIKKEDGTEEKILGLPKLKFYARSVKKEYRTGYDPNAVNEDGTKGAVRKIVGVHVDNRGEFLPKDVPNNPYRNEEYFRLKNADPNSQEGKMFKLLQKLKEIHVKNQEGLNRQSKLYLDFPRFEKDNLESWQSRKDNVGSEERTKVKRQTRNPIMWLFERIKEWIRTYKTRSDQAVEFNWQEENILVRADAYGDQIENIPISGLYNLDVNDVSTNIIGSMFRYLYGVEHHKQLVKMNPIAQGLKNILNDPTNLKEPDKIVRANYNNTGEITYVNKKGKYVRKDTFNSFYEREFRGQTTTGFGANNRSLHVIQNMLFSRASHAFFALNVPSALKNTIGAKLQAFFHSVTGKDTTPFTLVKGEAWAAKYMGTLTFGDAYAKGDRGFQHQLAELFDPSQDRFRKKFGESSTRTLLKDAASMSWLTSFRTWNEVEATMQVFAGMMYHKKVPMGDKMISYMDAWEIKNGKIQLKDGIDPEWGITYDADGNMKVGQKFKDFKSRIHMVINKQNGAYARFDQPELNRFLLGRTITWLKRFFTSMATNRFAKKRWNIGYGEIDQGYYITALEGIGKFLRTRNFADLTPDNKKAVMKTFTEVFTLMILLWLAGGLFDWDDDDEERYEKLRQKSGPIPLPFITAKSADKFNLPGFLELHMLNLLLQVKAENDQFIPWFGWGLDDATSLIDLKSIAFGPTTDTYQDILQNTWYTVTGDKRAEYARRVGSYEWQQEGRNKVWNLIGKSFGFTGSNTEPAQMLTNFKKASESNIR